MTRTARFAPLVINSGQHREMLEPMLHLLGVGVQVDLAVMRDRQRLSELTGRLVTGLNEVVRARRPDLVIVQGDTTTALCGALAAAYEKVPVAHVEAGLQTGDPYNPFPEEINRRLIGRIARWHFAPTERAAHHLYAEGVPAEQVVVTGNTVIDNLQWILASGEGSAFAAASRLLDHPLEYRRMASTANPFGDGKASERILAVLDRDRRRPDALLAAVLD
jgi:UDP-N-acetylglucosamine 2-epimerase (non-hydrolysing)